MKKPLPTIYTVEIFIVDSEGNENRKGQYNIAANSAARAIENVGGIDGRRFIVPPHPSVSASDVRSTVGYGHTTQHGCDRKYVVTGDH